MLLSKKTTSVMFIVQAMTHLSGSSPERKGGGGVLSLRDGERRETLPCANNGSGNSSHVLKCKSCSVFGKLDIL